VNISVQCYFHLFILIPSYFHQCFYQSFYRIIGLEPMHGIGPSDENKPSGTYEYLSFLGPLCAISSTVAEAVFPLIVFDLLNSNR
jgi:hypothetical protein